MMFPMNKVTGNPQTRRGTKPCNQLFIEILLKISIMNRTFHVQTHPMISEWKKWKILLVTRASSRIFSALPAFSSWVSPRPFGGPEIFLFFCLFYNIQKQHPKNLLYYPDATYSIDQHSRHNECSVTPDVRGRRDEHERPDSAVVLVRIFT